MKDKILLGITKMLKRFYMDKSHLLCTPIVIRSLYVNKNPFRSAEKDEELLGDEVSFLSVIRVIMFLVNYTLPDITFVVNSLARYNSSPTQIY